MNYDETKDEFTNLRAACRGRQDWVLATDDERGVAVLVELSLGCLAAGVSPEEMGCGCADITDTRTGITWRVSWLTIPKWRMPGAVLAAGLRLLGVQIEGSPEEDTDLIPLSWSAEGMARIEDLLNRVDAGRGIVRTPADVRAN